LERENLAIVGSFGQGGRQAGQFDWLHNIDVDASGNIYTAEVNNGRRIQKFSPTAP
jgi:sugar lactone lactonase YvrE